MTKGYFRVMLSSSKAIVTGFWDFAFAFRKRQMFQSTYQRDFEQLSSKADMVQFYWQRVEPAQYNPTHYLNTVVTLLNWLKLRKPSSAPRSICYGAKASAEQNAAVDRLAGLASAALVSVSHLYITI